MQPQIKTLVIGASGMLGNAMLRFLAQSPGFEVIGTARSRDILRRLPPSLHDRLVFGIDIADVDRLERLFAEQRPQVVINCVGMVKQLAESEDPLTAIPVNALLPHRLADLCGRHGARLVHISTDCVFAGTRGMYEEDSLPDATDLYGRSKLLGEVDRPHAITLRTSIIGHELDSAHGLVDWFLAQQGQVKGYTRAVFSGLPTVELARVVRDHVIPRPGLHGMYHVSAAPIAKFDLLELVAQTYGKNVQIIPDDQVVIDRSLDSTRFRREAGYTPPEWPELVRRMHAFG